MKRNLKNTKLMALALIFVVQVAFGQITPVFFAKSTTGVNNSNGGKLRGNSTAGDLIQLITVGENGAIDAADEFGNATADDVIIDSVHVGYGFPASQNEGKFAKNFSDPQLAPGTVVYLRAWDAPAVTGYDVNYGDSEPYQILSLFDEHDFGTWDILTRNQVPIELASFKATAAEDAIHLEWATESETENLGFHLYKSPQEQGVRERVTEEMIPGEMNSQAKKIYSYTDRDVLVNNLYYYWLSDISVHGVETVHGPVQVMTFNAPTEYTLEQNFPNPFNPSTTINYAVKDQGHVKLMIFNIRGQLIRSLVNEVKFAGAYQATWDGKSDQGITVPSGTYLYILEVNDYKEIRKMTFVK